MNKKDYLQEKIDNYLSGLLSEEEKIDFEQQMIENETLRKEVELVRQIAQAFQIKGESGALEEINQLSSVDELRSVMARAEKKQDSYKKVKIRRLIISVSTIAAVALILIIVGSQPRYDSQFLFSERYAPHEYAPTSSRGGYDELAQKQRQELYDAICMIQGDEPDVAISNLLRYSDTFKSVLREDVRWNLALAYLKVNQRDKAKQTLHELIESNSDYTNDALELLDKMKIKKWF